MDFYTNPASPNCRKVDATAKLLGIELDIKPVDFTAGDNRKPEYLAINPNGKVPALVDGDVKLWESNAIVCYLASKKDTDLWPKNNQRYDIMRWQAWELAHFGSAARTLTFERVVKRIGGGEPDADVCKEAEQNFKRFAQVLDDHLERNKYLVGGTLTLADVCVAAPLTYAKPAQLPLDEFKSVRSWLAALDEHEGWRASAPPPM